MTEPFKKSISVMVADDDTRICQLLTKYLAKEGYRVKSFADGTALLSAFKKAPADIVILDVRMPGLDGIKALREIKTVDVTTEVIVITGHADKDIAIQSLREGAFDLFEKPFILDELHEAVKRTVRYQSALRERDRLTQQVQRLSSMEAKRWGLDAFIGQSKPIKAVLRDILLLQKSDKTSVLITGESGTGKELVARAIHFGGPRASKPFIPVNCSAIPDELAESTMFGHMKGSFTGAVRDQKGFLEMADGGTLFLDEIGDMAPILQVKLLRVLEDETVMPVGSERGLKVDIRVLAATNSDLETRVQQGSFRNDLYFRLARYSIPIAPLRERMEDIPLFVKHFVGLFSHEMGISEPTVAPDFMEALEQYDFPGNVRELKNIVERAMITAQEGELRAEHLHLSGPRSGSASGSGENPLSAENVRLPSKLRDAEIAVVRQAIEKAGGNLSKAARQLGISRTKLYRMMK